MENIDLNKSIYDFVEEYNEGLNILIKWGFDNFRDEKLLASMGKNLKLKDALRLRGVDEARFLMDLEEELGLRDRALLVRSKDLKEADLKIEGILPCPVTLPLMEAFEDYLKGEKSKIDYKLKVASSGVDWIKDGLKDIHREEDLADLYISAGFDLFFDKDLMGRFREENAFKDMVRLPRSKDFYNESLDLRDPRGEYSVIGLVPAIFLVNKEEIGNRPYPKTWKDLFREDLIGEVALPVGDFDLFNAILLNINKTYGKEGLKLLARSFRSNMHPSEMVNSHKKKDKPTVTIMPYFFTKMVKDTGPMKAIWPEDGAIVSPIFLLAKRSKEEKLQGLVDFFSSKETGDILYNMGRFPSSHRDIDNELEGKNIIWLGWDYIEENNIGRLIRESEDIFNNWRDY